MGSRIIRNADDLNDCTAFLREQPMPLTLSWVKGADRTGFQNSLQWMWAGEVSAQLGDSHPEDVQATWKLEIGVPILRAEDDAWRETYDLAIKPQPYHVKLALMKQGYPVTSVMKVKQMIRYLDGIGEWCAPKGLTLTQPDEDLRAYHDRYRG